MVPISAQLLRSRPARNDHLLVALLISVGVHAGVLVIRHTGPSSPPATHQSLEVALVNAQTDLAPLDAQLLAQANLLGGGDLAQGHSTSPLPQTADYSPNQIVLAALRKRQQQLEQQQQRLLAQLESHASVRAARSRSETMLEAHEAGQDSQDQESLILNAEIAALKEQIERYNSRPRQHFTGPSTQASVYARYLETWRTHIEQLGTEHYPEQARGRVYGSLQLTVHIRRDGTLAKIDIDRPSEHAILNLAAQRVVQLAAPFAPLPPAIAKDTDILVITRTWHFQNQQLHTQIP